MKRTLINISLFISFISFSFVGCTSESKDLVTTMVEASPISSANRTVIPTIADTTTPVVTVIQIDVPPTETFRSMDTSTPISGQILLPEVTLSPQESETALLKLLKTNGSCTGKCLAGKLETIDRIRLRIEGSLESILGEDDDNFWLVNRDALMGFHLDSILKAYGVPSYVGYFFQKNVEIGAPLEGRTIRYAMNMYYEQIDLVVYTWALAYYDGENLFICPPKDPHNLRIEIYPERSMKEREEFAPVTWEA